MRRRRRSALFLALAVALAGLACSMKSLKKGKNPPGQDAAQADKEGEDDEQEASSRYKEYKPVKELVTVYFDYDEANLKEETRNALQNNAQWLKENTKAEIQIQGHCDDRGTVEYNLALGQRRAKAVRDYYKRLGVKIGRISTISYGEEQPVCSEETEPCRQNNRRAETLLRRK